MSKAAQHTADLVAKRLTDYTDIGMVWLPTAESQRAVLGNLKPGDAPMLILLPVPKETP